MRQSGRTVDPCAVQSPATVAVATDAPPVAAAADAAAAAITASCRRDRPSSRRLRSWRSPHRSSRRLRQRKRRRRRRHRGRRCDEPGLTAHRARLSSPQPTRRCPLHLETPTRSASAVVQPEKRLRGTARRDLLLAHYSRERARGTCLPKPLLKYRLAGGALV